MATIVILLFFVSQIHGQPIQPVGDKINQTKNEGDHELKDRVNVVDRLDRQKLLAESSQDRLSVSDNVGIIISKTVVSEGGRGIGSGGFNGGGGSQNPSPSLDAVVRIQPNPVPAPGTEVVVFGITNASSSSYSTFELFGPNCKSEEHVACAVESDLEKQTPPSFIGSIPDSLCNTEACQEFSVKFPGSVLPVKGDYSVRVTFYDSSDNVVAVRGENFTVLSFLVVPESPIGAILLVATPLGSLGLYYYHVRHS